MTEIRFERRATTEADVQAILQEIRQLSRDELFIVAGSEEEAIRQAIDGSREVWSGFADDKLVLIYGVRLISILSNHAYIWMISTELAEKYWVTFARATTLFTWELLQQYEQITAISPLKSKKSHKWLQYIGFNQTGVVRVHRIKFKTFSITRESLQDEKFNWLKGEKGWLPLLAS